MAVDGGDFDASVTEDDLKAAWLSDREKTYKAWSQAVVPWQFFLLR